jgi:hypothetical protein
VVIHSTGKLFEFKSSARFLVPSSQFLGLLVVENMAPLVIET